MKTRKHHIISRLSFNYDFIFIEPYRKGYGFNFGKKTDNIKVLTIPTFKMGNKFLNKIFNNNFFRKIINISQIIYFIFFLKSKSIKKPKLQIISNPFFIDLTKNFDTQIIWDYNDNPFQFVSKPTWITDKYRKFLNQVNIIFASSKSLKDKLGKKYISKIIYIPNGVDINLFKTNSKQLNKKFTIGYIGIISSWFFDFELIQMIAKTYKEINIRLIGPIDPLAKSLINQLKNIKNIHVEGKKKYEQLPEIISSFNIGLIPLKQTNKVYQLNSAKFLQYAAAGIPIISVPFEEFKNFENSVFFCKNNKEFIESINIVKNNFYNKKQNMSILNDFNWNEISKKINMIIKKTIE